MLFGKIENNRSIFKFILTILICCNCAVSIACQTKEQKVDAALKQCQQLLDKDKLSDAFNCYGEASLANPESGNSILDTGEKSIFKKCHEYRDKEDVTNALICYEGAAGLMPDKANVNFQLADAYFKYDKKKGYGASGDFDFLDKAETSIKKGLEISPTDAPAHSLYADILSEKGFFKEALGESKEAIRLAPDNRVYWIKQGLIQKKLNYHQLAIDSFQQALKISPNDTTALYFLEEQYKKENRLDEAIEIIERRIKLEEPSKETLDKLKELKEKRNFEKNNPNKLTGSGRGTGEGSKPKP